MIALVFTSINFPVITGDKKRWAADVVPRVERLAQRLLADPARGADDRDADHFSERRGVRCVHPSSQVPAKFPRARNPRESMFLSGDIQISKCARTSGQKMLTLEC